MATIEKNKFLSNNLTKLLLENKRIKKGESGFPISTENLIFYMSHLRNRVNKSQISHKTMERYINYIKNYHREHQLSQNAFMSKQFLEYQRGKIPQDDSFSDDFQVEYSRNRKHKRNFKTVVFDVVDDSDDCFIDRLDDFNDNYKGIVDNNDRDYVLRKLNVLSRVKRQDILNANDQINTLIGMVKNGREKDDIFYYFAMRSI